MNLRVGESVVASIVPNGGFEPGSARFSADAEGVVGIVQSHDNELEATITALVIGHTVITAEVDGDQDVGEGQTNILSAVGAIVVLAPDSTAIELQFGEPQPPAPPA